MFAENKVHFGVPIFEVMLPDFEAVAADIKKALLDMVSSDETQMVKSNHGGWHSRDDLHQSDHPSIRWLTNQIYEVGCQYIRHANKSAVNRSIHLVSMWANINNYGDWNLPHAHVPCEWSGCIYIDTNTQSKEKINGVAPGDIIFIDPLPMGEMYARNPVVGHSPENGKLLMFPGYLVHMVAPHYEQKSRISVAFNFRLGK